MPLVRRERWPVAPYNPLSTLAPRSYSLDLGTGTFGTTLSMSVHGKDVAERHAFFANFSIDFSRGIPQGGLSYFYDRLPATLRVDAFHRVVPRTVTASLETMPALEYLTADQIRLLLDTGPMQVDKTTVATFALIDRTCDAIGRLLVSGVPICKGTDGADIDCAAALNLTSRAAVPLTK